MANRHGPEKGQSSPAGKWSPQALRALRALAVPVCARKAAVFGLPVLEARRLAGEIWDRFYWFLRRRVAAHSQIRRLLKVLWEQHTLAALRNDPALRREVLDPLAAASLDNALLCGLTEAEAKTGIERALAEVQRRLLARMLASPADFRTRTIEALNVALIDGVKLHRPVALAIADYEKADRPLLLLAAMAHDPLALDAIRRLFLGWLRNTYRQRLSGPEADDRAHEVLTDVQVVLWQRRLVSLRGFGSLVKSAKTRRLIWVLKKMSKEREYVEPLDGLPEPVAPLPEAERPEAKQRAESEEVLDRALSELKNTPDRKRPKNRNWMSNETRARVIEMARQGRKESEIAEALGLPRGTVKIIRHRFRKQLSAKV